MELGTSHDSQQHSQIHYSPQMVRLWRPAAQRNLRNQWSKLNFLRQDWRAHVSAGLSDATSLVNSYLSQKYMVGIDLGVLSDMPNIQIKACRKLSNKQEFYRGKLISSYRETVAVVSRMVNACQSMRCYFTTVGSLLTQFSFSSEDGNDNGDCGGISVFKFWSIPALEELAWEVVQMFISDLSLKRLLVMELLRVSDETEAALLWSDEFYEGEFDDLTACNLCSELSYEPVALPSLGNSRSGASSSIQYKQQKDSSCSNVLQVYLTTWLVEVNIDKRRVEEIFGIVGEELHVDSVLAKSAS